MNPGVLLQTLSFVLQVHCPIFNNIQTLLLIELACVGFHLMVESANFLRIGSTGKYTGCWIFYSIETTNHKHILSWCRRTRHVIYLYETELNGLSDALSLKVIKTNENGRKLKKSKV